MYLTFTYNDNELDENVQMFTTRYDYLQGYIYTVQLSDVVCKSVYKEDYLSIKQLLRTMKIEKISNNKNIHNDYIFLNFFINNIDKIYVLEIE